MEVIVERDLEEVRRTCDNKKASVAKAMTLSRDVDVDKEIVIQDLDHCRYKVDHITVKSLPSNSNSISVKMDLNGVKANGGGGRRGGSTFGDDKPVIVDTLCDKEWGRDNAEFCMEKEIPDVNSSKVYDFEMCKARTLPIKLSPEEVSRMKRKWLCILSLAMSTILLLVIVIVVLVRQY